MNAGLVSKRIRHFEAVKTESSTVYRLGSIRVVRSPDKPCRQRCLRKQNQGSFALGSRQVQRSRPLVTIHSTFPPRSNQRHPVRKPVPDEVRQCPRFDQCSYMSPGATGTLTEPYAEGQCQPSSVDTPATCPVSETLPHVQSQSRQRCLKRATSEPICKVTTMVPSSRICQQRKKSFLLKLRRNLGHPSGQKLGLMLRQEGCSPRTCQGVMDLSCSTCNNLKEPQSQGPSTIKRELGFNDCIGIDGVVYTTMSAAMFHFYHMINYGTNYQVACSSPGKSSDDAIDKLLNGWLQWAGAPVQIHTDALMQGRNLLPKSLYPF